MALWVLDSDFTDYRGHNLEYLKALGGACQRRDVPWTAIVHRDVQPVVRSTLPVLPVLGYPNGPDLTRWTKFRRILNPALGNWGLYRDMRKNVQICSGDTLFVPNATQRHLLGLALWAHRQPTPARAAILFRFSFGPPHRSHPAAWLMRLALAAWPRDWNIACLCDSEALREEMSIRLGRPLQVAPIPALPGLNPTRGPDQPATVAFVGEPRDTRGFPELATALLQLEGRFRAGKLRALVQCNVRPELFPRTAAALDSLRTAALPNLELVPGPLTTPQYQNILRQAQILVLPYDPGYYARQTSGVFCEGIDANMVVICTRATWMEEQVRAYDLPGVVTDFGDTGQLVAALERAADHWWEWLQGSASGRSRFLAFHTPDRLLEMVLG